MNRSYVGIVTAQGLQAIYRESDQGDGQAALRSLQECADYLGAILPSSDTLNTFETH